MLDRNLKPNSPPNPTENPPEQFSVYEELFSKPAQIKNAVSVQTIQKLFFSIKVKAYFAYLQRYYNHAAKVCDEVMQYSAYDGGTAVPPIRNDDVTIFEMLNIARQLMQVYSLRHVGYFITDVLLIRPFALFAENTGQFRYPACRIPDDVVTDESEPFPYEDEDDQWDSDEIPF